MHPLVHSPSHRHRFTNPIPIPGHVRVHSPRVVDYGPPKLTKKSSWPALLNLATVASQNNYRDEIYSLYVVW